MNSPKLGINLGIPYTFTVLWTTFIVDWQCFGKFDISETPLETDLSFIHVTCHEQKFETAMENSLNVSEQNRVFSISSS